MHLGILSQRWRLLFRPIVAEPDKAVKLVKAMCVLHNYLRAVKDMSYCPSGFGDITLPNGVIRDGFWRHGDPVPHLQGVRTTSRSSSNAAAEIRERISHYFVNEGSVEWQYQHIHRR